MFDNFGVFRIFNSFDDSIFSILEGRQANGVISYIDDLGCYARTFDEFVAVLEELFMKLDSMDLRLNGSKCVFGAEEINYLGHIVSRDGVRHTPERIQAVRDMAQPTNKAQLHSFLGLCVYFHDSVPGLSVAVAPFVEYRTWYTDPIGN